MYSIAWGLRPQHLSRIDSNFVWNGHEVSQCKAKWKLRFSYKPCAVHQNYNNKLDKAISAGFETVLSEGNTYLTGSCKHATSGKRKTKSDHWRRPSCGHHDHRSTNLREHPAPLNCALEDSVGKNIPRSKVCWKRNENHQGAAKWLRISEEVKTLQMERRLDDSKFEICSQHRAKVRMKESATQHRNCSLLSRLAKNYAFNLARPEVRIELEFVPASFHRKFKWLIVSQAAFTFNICRLSTAVKTRKA